MNLTTVSSNTITIATISGKGRLRFLSLGRSTGGAVTVTLTIDGVNVINGGSSQVQGAYGTYLNLPIVGSINMSIGDTSTHLMAVLDEEGLSFKSSLVITVGTSTHTAYVAHAYKLL